MSKAVLILIASLLLAVPTTTKAADQWTTDEKVLEAAWLGLHIVDWKQTRSTAMQPRRYRETNPILGEHPTVKEVDIYMGLAVLLHPTVSHYLPAKASFLGLQFNPRKIWQSTSIGVSGGAVLRNFQIGLKCEF